MKTRIITAIVAICILLPVLIFSDTVIFPIAMAILSLVALYEMSSCIGLKKSFALTFPTYLLALGLPFLIRYGDGIGSLRQYTFAAICVAILYFFSVLTFSHGKYKLGDVAVWFMTAFYILLGFSSISVLRFWEAAGGKYVYLLVFIGAWVTDTFAYFCGMLLGRGGKHKLIPDVSPKKTWEGSIGGTVFCMISMVLFGLIINRISDFEANYLLLIIAGLLISVVSQIGDLCMSVIKRTYGIKDYGKLFPGHGGVLDRFDSTLAVAVILAAFCSFFDFFRTAL
ncbi:MAG: CDP-archaeol synthase [Ruminococcaceae bacterium]|nr:CDP-archaeol synthase [Oscillospiraceae bacterium]